MDCEFPAGQIRRAVSYDRMWCPTPITARWRNVAIFSWPIDDHHLIPFLPGGVVLDYWNGSAYISLVALLVDGLGVLGLPALPRRFEEVNLRFYVRGTRGGDHRRGVVFLRQLVAHPLITLGGRYLFREPMSSTAMRHEFDPEERVDGCGLQRVHYGWRNGGREDGIWITANGDPYPAKAGSLEEFLTARYYGYNGQSAGRTRTYRISRDAWALAPVVNHKLECDARTLYGRQFGDVMSQPPSSVLLADGSNARVHWPSGVNWNPATCTKKKDVLRARLR